MYIKVFYFCEFYIYYIRFLKMMGSVRLYCMLFYLRKIKREEVIILMYIIIFIIKLYIRVKLIL